MSVGEFLPFLYSNGVTKLSAKMKDPRSFREPLPKVSEVAAKTIENIPMTYDSAGIIYILKILKKDGHVM